MNDHIRVVSTRFTSKNPDVTTYGVRIYDSFYGVTFIDGWPLEPIDDKNIFEKIIKTCKCPSDAYGSLIQVGVDNSGLHLNETFYSYSAIQRFYPEEWLEVIKTRRLRRPDIKEECLLEQEEAKLAKTKGSALSQPQKDLLHLLTELQEEVTCVGGLLFRLKGSQAVVSSVTVKSLHRRGLLTKIDDSYVLAETLSCKC